MVNIVGASTGAAAEADQVAAVAVKLHHSPRAGLLVQVVHVLRHHTIEHPGDLERGERSVPRVRRRVSPQHGGTRVGGLP